jgi:oxidase EvaA
MKEIATLFYKKLEESLHKDSRIISNKNVILLLNELRKKTPFEIRSIDLNQCINWIYDNDSGFIKNSDDSFFDIRGYDSDNPKLIASPLIFQPEIGELVLFSTIIDNQLFFLVQAKAEPGNVDLFQLTTTIQATKSNLQMKHKGKSPLYSSILKYQDIAENTILDYELQEPSNFFYKKNNRNRIILLDSIEVINDNFIFLNFLQIKEFIRADYLVSPSLKSVISCIDLPLAFKMVLCHKTLPITFDNYDINSNLIDLDNDFILYVNNKINESVDLNESVTEIALDKLDNWHWINNEFAHKDGKQFRIIFCEISLIGREITRWHQPFLQSIEHFTNILLSVVFNGVRYYLIRLSSALGSETVFEIFPTISSYHSDSQLLLNSLFKNYGFNYRKRYSLYWSEEGGRFMKESVLNEYYDLEADAINFKNENFHWITLSTIHHFITNTNYVSIYLRNMISLL